MKKIEIALILVVAVVIGVIFSYSTQASRYGNFTDAFNEEGKTYKIKGSLNKEMPIESPQANLVIFNMIDDKGKEMKVYLNETVPDHFDRSDKIVITGKADSKKNAFFATELQAKCPSKYNDEQ